MITEKATALKQASQETRYDFERTITEVSSKQKGIGQETCYDWK